MCCEMEMPGGWTMSMMWMRMPGQTWFASALSFLFMWLAMMVALMLPSALEAETLKGGSDEELLAWAFANGRQPSEEEIEVWNAFMTKRGWHDAGTQWLNERLAESAGHRVRCRRCLNSSIWMKAGVRLARVD